MKKCYKCRNKIMNFENTVKVHTMCGRIRLYHFSCFPRELDPAEDRGVFARLKGVNIFWAFTITLLIGIMTVMVSGSVWFSIIFSVILMVVLILAPEPRFVDQDWEDV